MLGDLAVAWLAAWPGLSVWWLCWLLRGAGGAAGHLPGRLSLAFPYQSHGPARPSQGFLLQFLTKAMAWPGPAKAFSCISLPKPRPGQAQPRLSLAFPYQSHGLARPSQGFLLHFLTKAMARPDPNQKMFKNLHVFLFFLLFLFD